MRITGGFARGHKIQIPRSVSDLRPAQEIVRQAIFNWLAGKFEVRGAKVLDLFAGSGAFGLEALSRGAKHCDFVDHKKAACDIIQKNLKHSRFLGKAKIHCRDAKKFIEQQPPKSFDLIFLDPPYIEKLTRLFFEELGELLIGQGLIIYSHAKTVPVPANLANLQLVDTRNYGASAISFLTRKTKEDKMPSIVI